ncbi:MAG: hypothetical protein A2289_00885 [Deltaproteobacteria bacterium RIFOXYA12_FULL_58_15]|nr:MAG: hypothetical protein A2289_00885 [Deltaproteobacteria bacterium RIFOXYA12_FULL_58_15]OGR11262.1 MAG: hypothetical protein A2341_17640 [Deltaproteobacteria bacterium RIFOXYB12_FULL_58_9]
MFVVRTGAPRHYASELASGANPLQPLAILRRLWGGEKKKRMLMGDRDLGGLLEPLLGVASSTRHLRMVVTPGRVVIDRDDGSSTVAVSWDAEQHARVCDAVAEHVELSGGVTVTRLGNTIVLRQPPDPLRRMSDLADGGRLSSLAARFLVGSSALGKNILVAAPWCAGVSLVSGLITEGSRPVVVGGPGDAVPPTWPLVRGIRDAWVVGADRIGVWSLPANELVEIFAHGSHVVAWIDAARLDRALMRFEVGVERAGGSTAPLHVLAGIDLVVVMTRGEMPRVSQIAEITLAEEGYRPQLLFASNLPPVPTALMPVASPSFLDELERAGQNVLADELRHVGPSHPVTTRAPVVPAAAPVVPAAAPVAVEPMVRISSRPVVETSLGPTPRFDPALRDAPPPGWELDQLEEEVPSEDGATASPEDATLAATFGLAPPPPPPGAVPLSSVLLGGVEQRSFDEAMRRARARDDLLREEDDEDV